MTHNDNIIVQIQNSSLIKDKNKTLAFFYYLCYETFKENKNEVFNNIIYNNENFNEFSLLDWMNILNNLLKLKNTNEKVVFELINNLLISLLKDCDKKMEIEEQKSEISEVIINIITKIFKKNIEISKRMIELSKKNNLLKEILICLYSSKNKEKYDKSKNYILSQIIEYINNKDDELFEFIINEIIMETKEKKYENLIYIYQLMLKLTNKTNNDKNKIDLIKKCISKNINIDMHIFSENEKNNNKNKDSVFYTYYFTLSKFLINIFNLYDIVLITHFNKFFPLFIQCIKNLLFDNKKNLSQEKEGVNLLKENKSMIFNDLDMLTSGNLCNYVSPFLKDLVEVIICLDFDDLKVILNRIATKNEFDNNFNAVILNKSKLNELLLYFLKCTIESADKLTFVDVHKDLLKFFIQILNSHQELAENILNCFKSFILKINEKQLKELFENLLTYLNEKDDDNKEYILSNSIIVFQIFNTFLEIIKDIFIENYFSKYKNILIQLVHLSNSYIFKNKNDYVNENKLGSKRKRNSEKNNEIEEKFNYYKLSCLLIENITFNFKFSKGKLLVDTQEEMFDPVIAQFKLTEDENEMNKYYNECVKDCVLEMFKNIKSDDLFKEFNDELLNLIREDNYVTKLYVLFIIKELFDILKERYLVQVADIIPYVSELLEDSNTKVKKQAIELLKEIEKLTGESYQSYLE